MIDLFLLGKQLQAIPARVSSCRMTPVAAIGQRSNRPAPLGVIDMSMWSR